MKLNAIQGKLKAQNTLNEGIRRNSFNFPFEAEIELGGMMHNVQYDVYVDHQPGEARTVDYPGSPPNISPTDAVPVSIDGQPIPETHPLYQQLKSYYQQNLMGSPELMEKAHEYAADAAQHEDMMY
jgi:hypothetical protein